MRDAEEVAREAWCDVSWNAAEDWTCHTHETSWDAEDAWCPSAADLIRARDAEVRAETLAEVKQVVELHGFAEPEP